VLGVVNQIYSQHKYFTVPLPSLQTWAGRAFLVFTHHTTTTHSPPSLQTRVRGVIFNLHSAHYHPSPLPRFKWEPEGLFIVSTTSQHGLATIRRAGDRPSCPSPPLYVFFTIMIFYIHWHITQLRHDIVSCCRHATRPPLPPINDTTTILECCVTTPSANYHHHPQKRAYAARFRGWSLLGTTTTTPSLKTSRVCSFSRVVAPWHHHHHFHPRKRA